tara:strand:- start:247 stop:2157 length:1911 start_codon:yes stop_codon:yes gene_type:complete
VANYSVDIAIAVKGAKELKAVRAETTALSREINTLNKLANKQSKTLPNSFNTLNKVLGQAKGNLNKVALGTDRYFRAIADVIDKEERLSRAYKKQKTDFKVIERLRRKGLDINKQNIQQIRNELAAEIKLERAKRRTGKANIDKGMAGKQGMAGKLGGTASSAIIGGAFPLLFGQTGAAAVGGGIGGAAGGLIGGQFGFALSILGTAIGSFIQQQDELDKSLLKISRSFENAGSSAGFTRASFNELKSTLRMTKDEVLAITTEFARFGEAGESAAFIFGDNPNTFKNLAAIRDTNTLMTAILDTQNGLSIKQQIQLLREAKVTSFKDMQLKLNRLILEENLRREILEARQITRQQKISDIFKEQLKTMILMKVPFLDLEKAFPEFFKKSAEKAEENVDKIKAEFEELMVELPELQDLLTELDTQVQGMSFSIPSAIDSVSAELKKLTSVAFMVTTVADTVGSAFGESFKGIVKGSMTAQDALRNLFMRTADAFLDMAAQLIAKQIQMKILGIGLNFFGGGLGGSGGGQFLDSSAVPLVDPLTGIGTAADGGYIPGRKPTLVGERGAELFVPNTGGTVIPNHELGGMGGSTNIVVNVDASGSSVEGDEENGRELGRMISVAIQSELIKQKRPGGLLT